MKLLTVCALAGALLIAAVAARASIPQAVPQQSDDPIVLVADGCGPGCTAVRAVRAIASVTDPAEAGAEAGGGVHRGRTAAASAYG